jgi:hypothetical protein
MISNNFNKLIVQDDFFDEPNAIRELALGFEYKAHQDVLVNGWKGFRGEITIERHSKLVNYMHDKIVKLNPELANKFISLYFHYSLEKTKSECIPSFDEYKFHKDHSNWAGVVYLTPNADPKAGTILSSDDMKETKLVENIYNRFILYPSDILHAPADLFGNDINDGRMTLTVFIEN